MLPPQAPLETLWSLGGGLLAKLGVLWMVNCGGQNAPRKLPAWARPVVSTWDQGLRPPKVTTLDKSGLLATPLLNALPSTWARARRWSPGVMEHGTLNWQPWGEGMPDLDGPAVSPEPF